MLTDALKAELAARFGVPSLRRHQVEGIEAAASGMDVLQVVPTAGGKSLAFWAAGMLRGGVVLVLAVVWMSACPVGRDLALL